MESTLSVWIRAEHQGEGKLLARLYILPPGTDVVTDFKLLHLSWVTYGTTGCWEPWDHHFLAIVDLVCITVFINLYLLTILFADA